MAKIYFVTHPNVVIDPEVPITEWSLSKVGISRFRKIFYHDWLSSIDLICTSSEKKALDGANILKEHLNKPCLVEEGLGEFDRSSTGFMVRNLFEKKVDQFFQYPDKSVLGWETAQDAKNRITNTVKSLIADNVGKNIIVVSHGAVGALYLAYLKEVSIKRDLCSPGSDGGYYFVVDIDTNSVIKNWAAIDESVYAEI